MHLKRLEIQGFKSFADKIVLILTPVLPLLWDLTEAERAIFRCNQMGAGRTECKNLKRRKMEDVIFAGTEHRKPLGFAEVTLTFDNADSMLPVEFSEVTVTRRVYRPVKVNI